MGLSLRRIHERPSLIRMEEDDLFSGFERRFDNLFDQVFGSSLATYIMPETRGVFNPRIDIKETKESFKVVSELPGLDSNDIDVSLHDGMLTISGEKKVEMEEKGIDYQHIERSFGRFSRCIMVPDSVDMSKVESVYKNGVLTVTLPKTEKAIEEPKKIPVIAA